MATDSTLGVVPTGTVLDEVVFEMLEHQGIIHEKVGSKERKVYPAVLVAKADPDSLALARRSSSSPDGVIVVDKVIDLGRALKCFAGLEDRREDRFSFLVNELEIRLMNSIIESVSAAGITLARKSFWPENAPACCVITSDVDWLTYSPFHGAVVKGERSPGRIASLILGSMTGRNFGLNFDAMVKALAKYNYKSTVFLRTAYKEGEENLANALRLLGEAGFEIGLHGSDGAHTNLDSLNSQIEAIASRTGTRPKGVRHHILKMNIPATWKIESDAGLDYDATFSYNRYFGFRGEICFPYHPFATARLPLLELPTSFMDWTALKRGLRGKSAEEVMNLIMERVEHYHGLLMVNFHNTYLNRETFPDILRLYEGLIDRVSERKYWVATALACSEWWKKRAAAKPADSLEGGALETNANVPVEIIRRGEQLASEGV
jgi:peptidoglycan/xylan/chitin deacetylase (PgdA/CDA1 family)